jgi:pyrroline-5-carboxylate reductase
VTSPKGTTAAALARLEAGGLEALVNDAARAARARAIELGAEIAAASPLSH